MAEFFKTHALSALVLVTLPLSGVYLEFDPDKDIDNNAGVLDRSDLTDEERQMVELWINDDVKTREAIEFYNRKDFDPAITKRNER